MDQQTNRTRATGAALACAACCGLPMLVVAGVITAGLAMTLTVGVAAAAGVLAVTYLVVARRAAAISDVSAALLLVVGAASSGLGLVLLADGPSRSATAAVTAGVALLSCVALLRLPRLEPATSTAAG